ncbi:sulfatase family protein [Winogradskyella thalassocola]|uniref:Arylsulfatase A n=1 Tax=Winogradskyella thalassocola TaxID=262004 RepID=A0A1G7WEV5_9FLAO|nr:sulfatase [Winogradskyella thalassocola]SDG70527.1 Arylsulfatase A [Winogradskyella thalassocola]
MRFKIIRRCFQLFVFVGIATSVSGQDKPNILWVTIEDTSPQFIGCYGNENAETPVMDFMASQGVRFESAFSKGTVCSPSRSAIITGVPTYKMGSGNHRSSFPIPIEIKGFPKYLKDNGYYVTNNSKTDYNIANVNQFTKETWHESSNQAGWWNREDNQPFFSVFNIPDSHQSRTMSMPYEWYEKNVLQYLQPKQKTSDNTDEDLPKNAKLIPIQPEALNRFHTKHVISDEAFDMPPIYRDTDAMRKQVARVYNSIKLTDIKIGNILHRLHEDNLMDDTIVFIFADHGEGIPRGKTNGIGLGYRVPFIIWFPEKYKHLSPWGTGGIVTDNIIDFEDLAPTLLQITGIEIPSYMKGRPFLGKQPKPEKQYTYLSTDRADNGLDMTRTITDGRYLYSRNFMPFFPEVKYIHYIDIGEITQHMREDYDNGKLNEFQSNMFRNKPPEVLYDLKNDTWEEFNLVNSEAHQEILKTMRARLKTEILKERDVHFLPEYELGEISKNSTPYQFRMDGEQFDLKNIFEVANLVGKNDDASQFLKYLKSENEIVRYWASLGLYHLRTNLSLEVLEQMKPYLKDTYSPVLINIAATIYSNSADSKSSEVLKACILDENPHLALSAINYTLYFDDRSAFRSQVTQTYNTTSVYKVKASCLDFMTLEGMVDNNKQ